MRILQIRFKNLNSLAGEWEIDLTHPAYASDGIFAITGPTGAGKTTILDALCLALYGRTPRLDRVTKGGNEIISRRTGECFAEVTFETQAGRFRCHWSQHRARKKPGGDLQPPKHEVSNADTGEVFETKLRDVAAQIEAVTGMDFDRFTRSMLLAQGGFSAFLQAAPDDRAPILEQITGTEIYSLISICVHERQREEREKLNLLQAETAGIFLLSPAQEQEIQQELEAKQKEEAGLSESSIAVGQAITWRRAIDGMKKEIIALEAEEKKLQADMDVFQPERVRLNRALLAATLEGAYAALAAIRKQQAEDHTALKTGEEALPELESAARKQAESLKLTEQQAAASKEALKAALPIIQKVRAIDQTLGDRKKTILEDEENCRKDAARIDADVRARALQEEKRSHAQKALALADGYLREHTRDEWLIGGLAGVEANLGSLLSRQKEILNKEESQRKGVTALERVTKSLAACRELCAARKQALDDASKSLQQGNEELKRLLKGRLLREYRADKETLLREKSFLEKIAELEDHRARLEDGTPCPLCGSKGHPFAAGNVPVPDEIDGKIEALTFLIRKVEDQESAVRKLEEAAGAARSNLVESEKQEVAAASDKTAAEKAIGELQETLEKLRADFTNLKQSVSVSLLPLGITEIPDADVPSFLESLKTRLKAWQGKVAEKAEIEKQMAAIDGEIIRLDAVMGTQRLALAEKQDRLEALKKAYAEGLIERKELYGEKSPDEEERNLNSAVSTAEDKGKTAGTLHTELQQKMAAAKAHVEDLKKRIARREPDFNKSEAEFSQNIVALGFADEGRFLEDRLPVEKRDVLSSTAKKLDNRQTELRARQKDRENRLAEELDRKVTDQALEALESQQKAFEDALKTLRDSVAGLVYRLRENAGALEKIKEKQAALEARKNECRRWGNLHELIGSADGKKYRNFAQGLTFDLMVGHANRQLQKMSDRYLLIRDDAQPLELNVIDSYQAGEIRSTKNLSGGESFIVSLALALGLSHMASKKVRVDSLFLDEGFGTLDEDALDIALETLGSLHEEGKLIGVISHVPALKERIATRIQVIPRTGGRSGISGPGCSARSDLE